MPVLQTLLHAQLVAIIRGADPGKVLDIAAALKAGGIRCLEITLNSSDALSLISRLRNRHGDSLLVGAGTVLNAADAQLAIEAGAQFIISPCLDTPTINVTKIKDCVSIPGAYTPTEIVKAYDAGADLVKVFPAGSPQYIKDIVAPLGHIPLMPTGGVQATNIAAYKKAGGVAFGIGSALVDVSKPFTEAYLHELQSKARELIYALQ